MTLKGEQKADQLRNLGLKEQHSGKFAGLAFCLMYCVIGVDENSNPEMQQRR